MPDFARLWRSRSRPKLAISLDGPLGNTARVQRDKNALTIRVNPASHSRFNRPSSRAQHVLQGNYTQNATNCLQSKLINSLVQSDSY